MSELPTGWTIAKIGEINAYKSETIDPSKFVSKTFELYSVPSFPTHRPEILEGKEIGSTKQKVKPDDVLLCKINPRINRVWVVGEKAEHEQIASSEWIVLRQPQLDSNFIRYQLRESDFRERLCVEVSGVGGSLTRAQPKKVEGYALRIAPLAEQRRIAQKLDALLAEADTLKARIDAIPTLLKRFRHAVVRDAVKGALGDVPRSSEAPDSWSLVSAEDVCSKVQSGGTPKEGFTRDGIPFLKVYNLVNGVVDFGYRPQYISSNVHYGSCKKSIALPGDVLMNIVGPPLGKIAIVPSTYPEWNINQAITLFRPSERITSRWIHLVLLEGTNIRAVSQRTKGSAGQVNISLSQCREFAFPVPSVEVQNVVCERVERLLALADHLEAKVGAAQKRIDTLTQSLLAKAFRGELVPQDPNDEPASVLLERIRAQRTAAPKPKRGRKVAAD